MITVVVGPPCAGKSTLVRNESASGDVIVDFDLIATALGADGHRPEGPVKDAAFVARQAVVDLILEGIDVPAWIIHSAPSEEQVLAYREVGAVFIVEDPGVDVCLERAAADERPDGTVEAIEAWYESPPDLNPTDNEPGKSRPDFARKEGPKNMETKSFAVKASPKGRSFEGYASTWTRTPDSYGDVVEKGAFEASLDQWEASGKSIPVLWSHEYYNPQSFVAKVVEIEEDAHGLRVKGEFFDDPASLKVHRLIQEKVVSEMSFAFDIVDSDYITIDGAEVRSLRKLNLYEVSLVMLGANSDTSIESVKLPQRLSDDEFAALKELAAREIASEEEEVAAKSRRDEELLRVKTEILALVEGGRGDR